MATNRADQKLSSGEGSISSAVRACAMARYLVCQGVDPKIVAVLGFSKYHPMATNDTEEGRQQNRRVEIVLFPSP